MRLIDFPGCCSAKILTAFGQERNAVYGMGTDDVTQVKLESLLTYERMIEVGLVVAILTQNQTVGIDLLLKNGFVQGPWVRKNKHHDTQIATFTLELPKWEPIKKGDGETWFRHRGTKSVPKRAVGKRVVVQLRNGVTRISEPEEFWWYHTGSGGDIMKYRIAKLGE